VSIEACDAFGNVARGYAGTVRLTTGAATTLPGFVTLTNGEAGLAFTFKTAGRWTVTATDTAASSITGTTGTMTVTPGAATQFTATAGSTAVANRYLGVVVKALDAYGNIATGYSGTVHLTSTDPSATLPADGPLYAGQRTYLLIDKTVGSQTVTATDTANASLTATTGTIAITAR
jgi:hypothetical protein